MAEPGWRASRFDERGIALQTVIIMVVLLAIAGGVAAVLFSRGQSATQQLESQNIVSAAANEYTSETLCGSVTGLTWHSGKCKYDGTSGCTNAGGKVGDGAGTPNRATGKCYSSLVDNAKELGEIKS